jgi:hypothetical protein
MFRCIKDTNPSGNFLLPPRTLPGVNPTIASYSASAVIFYNTTGSLARFENKNILFYFEKRCRLHTTTLAL